MEDFKKGSIGTIYTLLQKEYEAEEGRSKQLETKAQVLLAVSGVLSSTLMLLLKSIIENGEPKLITFTLISGAFGCLIVAMVHFLFVFQVQFFLKIKHNAVIAKSTLNMEDDELKYHLAHDYFNCIEANIEVGNIKKERFKIGTSFLLLSIALFTLTLVIFTAGLILQIGSAT